MRRKILVIVICIALLLSLLGAVTAFADETTSYDIIRVKLSIGNTTIVPLYLDGNYSVSEDNTVILPRQLYTVTLEDGQLNLHYGDTLLYTGSSLTLVQHSVADGRNNFIRLNNAAYGYTNYSGDLAFTIDSGCISLINHIYLEDYLYGVVPYEMSDSWPVEALKAQAIVARSYAVRYIGSRTYDVTDTVEQTYRGFNPSNTNAIAAVNATANMVLKYGDIIVPAYYSASNGGYTDIPYHVWGGGADWVYYDIQEDPFDVANPSSLYEEVFFPVAINAEHQITSSDNVTGQPNTANAEWYIKQAILFSGKLTDAGYEVATVNDFTLSGVVQLTANMDTLDTDSKDPHTEDHNRVPSSGVNNCVDFIYATGTFTVTATKLVGGVPTKEQTVVQDVGLDLRYFDASNGIETYRVFNQNSLRLFVIEAVTADGNITGYSIFQRRHGHGLGLSQRGAQQRANAGQSYQNILSFYYPQTTIGTLPNVKPALTTIAEAADSSNATIFNCDSLNVRNEPDTDWDIIGTLFKAARVEVTRPYVLPDWHEFNYGSYVAYIHKGYVRLDHVLYSSVYTIDRVNGLLQGVADKTTAAQLATNMYHDSGNVVIYNQNGAIYTGDCITSGMTIKLIEEETVKDELEIVVLEDGGDDNPVMLGDCNGDGKISITDYTLIRLDILGLKALPDVYRTAGDINSDGNISITDYTLIRLDILGLKKIN